MSDGAEVAGALARLVRATEPTDPRYEAFRQAYAVALEAAGLVPADPGSLPEGHCPHCGSDRPLGSSGVCTGCAAKLGWDPQCPACLADQYGQPTDDLVHLGTCNPNRS